MASPMLARLWRAAYLLLTLAVLLWSANFVVGRAFSAVIPPVSLAFWRWVGASLLVLGFAWPHLLRDLPVLLRHWPRMLLLAAVGVSTFNTCAYIGLQTTTAINGVLLQSSMPVIILVFTFVFFHERPSAAQLAGVALSLAGVTAIITQGAPLAIMDLAVNPGDGWIMVATIAYAAYSALLRLRPPVHPLSFLAACFVIGTILLLPFYLIELASGRVLHLDGPTAIVILYVAIGPSFLSYLFYNRGIELLGANRAGQFMYLVPAFGTLMAVIFLGESLHAYHAVGIALIALGVALASRRAVKKAMSPVPS
jgi:drug/metabolite transporter (DMT)-like permease